MLFSLSEVFSPSLHLGLTYSFGPVEMSLPQDSSPDPTGQVPAPSSIPLLNSVPFNCPKHFSFVALIVVEINYIHDSPT